MFPNCRFSLASSAFITAISTSAPALANECGDQTPDYSARRTITVDGKTASLFVFVSGSRVREERDIDGKRKMIVLRLPDQHEDYAFDATTKQAVRLPPVKPTKKPELRVTEEPAQDGLKLRHVQFLSGGTWHELSTTKCTSTGVMVLQTFTTVNPEGRLAKGELRQTDIKVAPQPETLFHLPADVELQQQ